MEDYKQVTTSFYDTYAADFERNTQPLFASVQKEAEEFISALPGPRVLDLGSGPGRDSLFFKQRGLHPLCLDISPEMVRMCKEKGLCAMVGDIENMPFEDGLFQGVWAYSSLLHIPKKSFPQALSEIARILVPRGIFGFAMKQGSEEGYIESDKYPGQRRFFAYYSDAELRSLLSNFDIMHSSTHQLGDAIFLNYLAKRLCV